MDKNNNAKVNGNNSRSNNAKGNGNNATANNAKVNGNNSNNGSINSSNLTFFEKVKFFVKENRLYIILGILIILIIFATYYYSEYYRPKNNLKNIMNGIVYDEDREQIDFCGQDNFVKEKIYSNVTFNYNDNSITFLNPNINLYELGLSSEYFIDVKKSKASKTNNDGTKIENINDNPNNIYYKILRVSGVNKLIFQKDETCARVNSDEIDSEGVVITYFRPAFSNNLYKRKPLTDYYICSSHNSFLIGNQKADYCDENMIKYALHFGARYIELEIMNKDLQANTEPIVCTGVEKGNIITSLNYLNLNECLNTISLYAFAENFLQNYNDPLFLFLNLKTNDNYVTLDKIHDLIVGNLGKYLLTKDYNHVDISKLNLCELRRKLVILTNKSVPESKLDKLINASCDKPYLNRIRLDGIDLIDRSNKPKFTIKSSSVRFTKDLDSYITLEGGNIDFLKNNITNKDYVQINNANSSQNNSGDNLYKVKIVGKSNLVFEDSVEFSNEAPGASVIINIYDENYIKMTEGIETFNKNSITIVIPNESISSSNFDFKKPFYKGCQFVCMNFQVQDEYMKKYFNYFKKRSFRFKSDVLVNTLDYPKPISLNTLVPQKANNPVYKIDNAFLGKINSKITIQPYVDNKLHLINDNRNVRFSLAHNLINSEFILEKGLDRKANSVSIRLGDRYLHTNDTCCYLYFTKKPDNSSIETTNKFNKNASFLPLVPNKFKKGFNSFGIVKEEEINGVQTDVLYYLKVRKYYSPKVKLYTKNVSKYEVKFQLNSGDGNNPGEKHTNGIKEVVVLKPFFNKSKGFFPLGDIVIERSKLNIIQGVISPDQDFSTLLVSGAIDRPKDYELVYDNKYFVTKNSITMDNSGVKLSIWKPIPNDGFSAVGYIFNRGFNKPALDEVCCVSNNFLKEIQLETNPFWYHLKSNLMFWKNTSNNYMQIFNAITRPTTSNMPDKPNPIDNLIFDIITDEKDYSDRLYLDKKRYTENDELLSTIFKVDDKKSATDSSSGVYDYLMDIQNSDSKIVSYTTSGSNNMCVSMPQPYWSSFFDTVDTGAQPEEKIRVDMEPCKDDKYVGTNWNIYNDKSIRLKDNSEYCLTYNTNENNRPVRGQNNKDNYLFLSKCSDSLNNQQFLVDGAKIVTFDENAVVNNDCLYHGKDNKLKLEQCDSPQYSVVYKWGDNIRREDKCSKNELEEYMVENITHVEMCENRSYYAVYREEQENNRRAFKNFSYCDKERAKNKYESLKGKHDIAALVFDGKPLSWSIKGSYIQNKKYLDSYAESLKSKANNCTDCYYPNRLICADNNYVQSKQEYFDSSKTKSELIDYCYNMKPNNFMKCDKQKRQRFITNKFDPDFCLGESKEVFVYINSNSHHFCDSNQTEPLNINLYRGNMDPSYKDNLQIKIDNLLNEAIDQENYHIFVKGILSIHNKKEYRIVFQPDKTGDDNALKPIILPKTSYDIFLNRIPNYDLITVGSKVLCRLELGDENSESIGFVNKISDKEKGNIMGTHVRWLAVVIKKLKNKNLKVMFSINSYEYDPRRENAAKLLHRPFQSQNFEKIVNISEVVLLKKAPICA